ncbi:MAG: polyprenyl synthetase family protein [Bacillota bacterium]
MASYLDRWAARVDEELRALLPPEPEAPGILHRAMRYSTLAPGKRLRAVLAVAGCEAAGGDGFRALPAGAAIEMIHAYSLIHDDLPAMDNDDWRRGQPSCHRAFGEAAAILAGDALQTLAFEVLADLPRHSGVSAATALAITGVVARAAGSRGMAGGQAADLAAAGRSVDRTELDFIYRHKTGALIRAAVVSGALVALDSGDEGLNHPVTRALAAYAESVGVAFQIVDDLLDAGDDAAGQEASYPRLFGVQEAARQADRLTAKAIEVLAPLGSRGETLRALARLLRNRTV